MGSCFHSEKKVSSLILWRQRLAFGGTTWRLSVRAHRPTRKKVRGKKRLAVDDRAWIVADADGGATDWTSVVCPVEKKEHNTNKAESWHQSQGEPKSDQRAEGGNNKTVR